MTHTYSISGMTCNSCVIKAKSEILKVGGVMSADIQLQSPQAIISMEQHIPVSELQKALQLAGPYVIKEADRGMQSQSEEVERSWFETYKPIFLIGLYITGITLLIEANSSTWNGERWMRHFMAAFFLVFSFFKLLNVKAFAESYASYDVIAKRWMGWGYVYAFIELALGLAYLLNLNQLVTNAVTFVIMSISIIGVLQSVLKKRKIQCACLGAVFNLPMSTITIIEDLLMIGMSGSMLVILLK